MPRRIEPITAIGMSRFGLVLSPRELVSLLKSQVREDDPAGGDGWAPRSRPAARRTSRMTRPQHHRTRHAGTGPTRRRRGTRPGLVTAGTPGSPLCVGLGRPTLSLKRLKSCSTDARRPKAGLHGSNFWSGPAAAISAVARSPRSPTGPQPPPGGPVGRAVAAGLAAGTDFGGPAARHRQLRSHRVAAREPAMSVLRRIDQLIYRARAFCATGAHRGPVGSTMR
jgi:hypothetical protein